MLYTDQSSVEQFLNRSLTAGESNLLSTVVAGVEALIDGELETTFKNTPSLYGQVRYFDGGHRHVDIDPCQNITDITLVNPTRDAFSTLTSDLYTLRPQNSLVTSLIALRYGRIPRGYANLRVTADFTEHGAEDAAGVPSDIKLATTRLVGSMLMFPEAAVGLQEESVEGHNVKYQRNFQGEAATLLNQDPVVRNIISARIRPLVDDTLKMSDLEDSDDDSYYLGNY